MNNGIRLLLIEDNDDDAELIQRELVRKGLRITVELVCTAEAMKYSLDQQLPDIVISDYNLPDFTGLQALKLFKQRGVDIPFIFVTGTLGDEKAAELMKLGAQDYILKDNLHRLAPAVERELHEAELRRQKKETEQVLHKTEVRLHQLVNSSLSVIYANNYLQGYQCTFVSENLLDNMGYLPEEILDDNQFWSKHLHPDDHDWVIQEMENKFKEGGGTIEYRFQHKNGNFIWIQDSFRVFYENGEPKEVIGSWTDVTKSRELIDELSYQASHDVLTKLFNRKEFEIRLKRLISTAKRDQTIHALCYVDLDQFKIINDTCGHVAGDELLRQLSALLLQHLRKHDTLARLGGDEFGLLLENCTLEQSKRAANAVLELIKGFKFNWRKKSYSIGASIGLVEINERSKNVISLMRQVDEACYAAKESGRNRINIYDDKDKGMKQLHGDMQWVARINSALEEKRFHLYFQLIQSLINGHKDCIEVLIRLEDEQGKIVAPGTFLPAAERYNLSIKLDCWVMETIFSWLDQNQNVLMNLDYCAINLSGQTIVDNGVLDFVIMQLDKYEILNGKICFEVSVQAAITNLSKASTFMSTLKGLGCRFALDDFGSGMSSFAYLKNLPVDVLKIDGVFVKNMVHDRIDHAMVKSINEIGQVMGKKTVAEFVENDEIIDHLAKLKVDFGQGYGIAKPRPIGELMQTVSKK